MAWLKAWLDDLGETTSSHPSMATFKLHSHNISLAQEAILARRLEYAAVTGDWGAHTA